MTAGEGVPVGGRFLDRFTTFLLLLFGVSVLMLTWRFVQGLGATTALSDTYPWGLWIAFDVVTGTALGCGGYAVAILVYVFNKGEYHPLVRPALVTSALGYTLGGFGVLIDVGRYWYIYKVPLYFQYWNLNSILLEVALCITLYTLVLWIELSPALLEKWSEVGTGAMKRIALRVTPVVKKSMIWLIALGLLLPTMHQSSLGSLMLLAGSKLHPFWQTPFLPLLFLISCIGMGYGVVIMESALSSMTFRRPFETKMLASMAPVIVAVLGIWCVIRLADLAVRGELAALLTPDLNSAWFLLEMALFVVPMLMLLDRKKNQRIGHRFRAGMMIVSGGAAYRFGAYQIGFDPGVGSYFPSVPEILTTVGLVALEITGYILIVRIFPVLRGASSLPAPA